METSSLLLLLDADILQSQRAGDEADLAALLHQPSYPPVIVVFLEQKTVTASVSQPPLSCYPQPPTPRRQHHRTHTEVRVPDAPCELKRSPKVLGGIWRVAVSSAAGRRKAALSVQYCPISPLPNASCCACSDVTNCW